MLNETEEGRTATNSVNTERMVKLGHLDLDADHQGRMATTTLIDSVDDWALERELKILPNSEPELYCRTVNTLSLIAALQKEDRHIAPVNQQLQQKSWLGGIDFSEASWEK